MNAHAMTERLARFPVGLRALVTGTPDDELRWRPDDGAWSIMEIVAHLAEEEELDFAKRLRSTLQDPEHPWDPIDPEGWATERRYNEWDLEETLARFERARATNLQWLRSHQDEDWSLSYRHPSVGKIAAGELFASWVAHDALHLRQIAKRLFQLTVRDAQGHPTDYAGQWGP